MAVLAYSAEAFHYYSGEVKTKDTYRYGKFRTHMTILKIHGTCSTMFLYWEGRKTLGSWEEIDVEIVPSVELAPYNNSPFISNIIYGNGVSKL